MRGGGGIIFNKEVESCDFMCTATTTIPMNALLTKCPNQANMTFEEIYTELYKVTTSTLFTHSAKF
jgi:hypothetical protein